MLICHGCQCSLKSFSCGSSMGCFTWPLGHLGSSNLPVQCLLCTAYKLKDPLPHLAATVHLMHPGFAGLCRLRTHLLRLHLPTVMWTLVARDASEFVQHNMGTASKLYEGINQQGRGVWPGLLLHCFAWLSCFRHLWVDSSPSRVQVIPIRRS